MIVSNVDSAVQPDEIGLSTLQFKSHIGISRFETVNRSEGQDINKRAILEMLHTPYCKGT